MLEQDYLHHGTPLAVIPSGNSAKYLRLPLDSRSSVPAEVYVKTFLRSSATPDGKEKASPTIFSCCNLSLQLFQVLLSPLQNLTMAI